MNYYNTYMVKSEVVKVNGRNGAEAYQMAPNSSALLLDETAPLVWLVQTDGAGYKTCTPFDIKIHEEKNVLQDIQERLARLEKAYEQSDSKRDESITVE